MSNNSFAIAVLAVCIGILAGCGSESAEPPPSVGITVPADDTPVDPMSVIPDDISLWEAFDPKRILKQPDTNTLVVEGVVPGNAAELATELEALVVDKGWTTDTLANNEGLSTLIMSKDERRLKVNLTQNGEDTGVYLTTRLPE